MGLKACPTCVLNVEDAQGVVVGDEGSGLKTMCEIVNAMPRETGIEGLGDGGAPTAKSLVYAAKLREG